MERRVDGEDDGSARRGDGPSTEQPKDLAFGEFEDRRDAFSEVVWVEVEERRFLLEDLEVRG